MSAAGMKIQLGGAVADSIEHADDVVLAQMTALMQAEQRVGRGETPRRHHAAGAARERAEDYRLDQLAGGVVLAEAQRRHHALAREANARHFVFDGKLDENIGEQRMDVEIQMAVDMIEVADEFEMTIDLRAQLVGHRCAERAIEEIAHAGADWAVDELARRAHRGTESRRVEDTASPANDGMQADVESRIVARDVSGGTCCGLGDHQARAAENAVAMSAEDAGVDFGRQAEVVGVDNQALQTAAPRVSKPTATILLVSGGLLKDRCGVPN